MRYINHESLLRRLLTDLDDRFLFVFEHDRFAQWTGIRWDLIPRQKFREIVGNWAYANYQRCHDENPVSKDTRFWSEVCDYRHQDALVAMAEGPLLAYARDFDNHPLLLNCPNGTVDLVTGAIKPHDPDDRITRVTSVDYLPGFQHPDWTQALSALPEALHDWYQLRLGQAITGEMTPDGRIIFQTGTGDNGKSGITSTIRFALGTRSNGGYSFLANRSVVKSASLSKSGINSSLAAFEGMRIAMIEELDDSHYLSTTAIKELADTETITARQPYKQENEFSATHSLFVNSNFQPAISETDDGTWRRLLLVRFPYKFTDVSPADRTDWHRDPDPTLKARLHDGVAQRQAALSWLVAGSVAYHAPGGRQRFQLVPSAVQRQTSAWRADTDLIMAYIETFLVFDPNAAVRPDDLRNHFNEWISELGHQRLTAGKLNQRFENHTLVTAHNVERNKQVRVTSLANMISYPPDFLGDPIKMSNSRAKPKVWVGFRYRTAADDYDTDIRPIAGKHFKRPG
jgi:P4 family phage/plasmid primase-like protien